MVLSKLPVPGRPANLVYSTVRASVLAVGAGGGCLYIFSLIYHFSCCIVVVLLFYVHGKHLRLCRDGQLT